MQTNPNDPVYPNARSPGITVREHFAALAMWALVHAPSDDNGGPTVSQIAEDSVLYADALIRALNK
jgi:hypothetical protein